MDHMTAEEALAALDSSVPGLRAPVRDAVFQYWKTKRMRQGKPLLRRLQAPTNPSDTNPFNVFRWQSSLWHGQSHEHPRGLVLRRILPLPLTHTPDTTLFKVFR